MNLYLYLLIINLISYVLMRHDKHASKSGQRRIPENQLLFIGIIGGSLGIFLGMKSSLNHKSTKWKFKYGIPLLILIQIFTIVEFNTIINGIFNK